MLPTTKRFIIESSDRIALLMVLNTDQAQGNSLSTKSVNGVVALMVNALFDQFP